MIEHIITQAMQAYHEHVGNRLAEIPAGAILCVHEQIKDTKDDAFKVTFMIESHILTGDEKCEKKVRKTMYGPKGG